MLAYIDNDCMKFLHVAKFRLIQANTSFFCSSVYERGAEASPAFWVYSSWMKKMDTL